jgi:hypothetical protein
MMMMKTTAWIQWPLLALLSCTHSCIVVDGFILIRSRKGPLLIRPTLHAKPLYVLTSRNSRSPLPLVVSSPLGLSCCTTPSLHKHSLIRRSLVRVGRTFTECYEGYDARMSMIMFSVPRKIESDTTTSKTSVSASWIREFIYGAEYVHTQYLPILWKYSIVQSFAITLPFVVLLWTSHLYSSSVGSVVYSFIFRILHTMLALSSGVARLLQLPLTLIKWTLLTALPGVVIPFLQYLPNVVVVPLVNTVLYLKDTISIVTSTTTTLAATTTSTIPGGFSHNFYPHEFFAYLSSFLAILIWRPAIEELQYRSILNKILFAPTILQNLSKRILNNNVTSDTRSSLFQGRIMFRSTGNKPTNPPTSMVEFVPLSRLEEEQQEQQRAQTRKVDDDDGGDSRNNTGLLRKSFLPSVPNESNRILLGSLLFAITRLGWLSSDVTSDDLYLSPYGWTIGFVQSMLTHFSSSVMVETRPSVRIWIVLLAIHQTVSTYLVSQHIFAQLYIQRGLPASIGAHIAWTVSKGTVLFRLLWRFWLALYNRTSLLTNNWNRNWIRTARES